MKQLVLTLALTFLLVDGARAQSEPARSIYVIFDASGSMWGKLPDESYKIHTAKSVLENFLFQDLDDAEIAFRAYGHRREGDCSDTELVIPFGKSSEIDQPLRSFLKDVNPRGKTPIHRSLSAALDDFGDRTGDIVLITDGIETCNADPCALMREWKEKNIDINVHVVGFGLEEKEKEALACISKEAGTPFYEANSAEDLTAQLQTIKEVRVPDVAFKLKGMDGAGNQLLVEGELVAEDGMVYEVSSNGRFVVPSGKYTLQAGVQTRNGNLYHPVQSEVTVASVGETTETVTVDVPPTVHVSFLENGEPAEITAGVSVYQDSKELFNFRSVDVIYIDEGTYEFRASPNADNDVAVQASIDTGEEKEVVFILQQTVKMHVKMFASGSSQRFQLNLGLYQDGEEKYRVHPHNNAQVLPGTYIVRMEAKLHSYEEEIVVTEEDNQQFSITVPVGHAIVRYQTVDGAPDKKDRCFASKDGSNSRVFWRSDELQPLRPGVYTVKGWRQKGDYDPVTFEIKEGEETEVILRAKK